MDDIVGKIWRARKLRGPGAETAWTQAAAPATGDRRLLATSGILRGIDLVAIALHTHSVAPPRLKGGRRSTSACLSRRRGAGGIITPDGNWLFGVGTWTPRCQREC